MRKKQLRKIERFTEVAPIGSSMGASLHGPYEQLQYPPHPMEELLIRLMHRLQVPTSRAAAVLKIPAVVVYNIKRGQYRFNNTGDFLWCVERLVEESERLHPPESFNIILDSFHRLQRGKRKK